MPQHLQSTEHWPRKTVSRVSWLLEFRMLYNFTKKKDTLLAQGSRGGFKEEGEVELRKTTQKKTARAKSHGLREAGVGGSHGDAAV